MRGVHAGRKREVVNPEDPSERFNPDRPTHYSDSLRREPWKVLNSAEHRFGPRRIHVDEIVSPDESRRLTWVYFHARHAVAILALDDEENALLVREYRHPVGREIFNLPAGAAGAVASEEELREHAARELAEETCMGAREWIRLGAYHPMPPLTSLTMTLFLARDLYPVERGEGEEWCEIEEVARVPFRALHAAALAGEIEDGETILAVLWAGALHPHLLR